MSTIKTGTTTTTGLVVEADTSGNLVVQTGATPTTALTISGTNQQITPAAPISMVGGYNFRNKIINGNFDVWQRGTSQTSNGYGSADRWAPFSGGSTKTTSRQSFDLGQTDVPNNPKYFIRNVVTSVAGTGNYAVMYQKVEGVETLSGKTATLSFWAKADASKNIAIEFVQNFGTGGSPSSQVAEISSQLVALTTSWTKYTIPVDIPSVSGKTLGTNRDDYIMIQIWFDAGSDYDSKTASLGQQSGTFDIAQVQLEEGSAATPFEMRPINIEAQLCMRYYQYCGSSSSTNAICPGYMGSSTSLRFQWPLTVAIRDNPSFVIVSGAAIQGRYLNSTWSGSASTPITSLPTGTIGGADPRSGCATSVGYTIAASTGGAGSPAVIAASGQMYFDAEL